MGLSKEELLSARRLSQPKTYNIFSPDYKVAECYGCGKVFGIDLLRRVKGHLYCYFCFLKLQSQVEWHEIEKGIKKRKHAERIKYIQEHPELSLRRLGSFYGISHETVRQIRKQRSEAER